MWVCALVTANKHEHCNCQRATTHPYIILKDSRAHSNACPAAPFVFNIAPREIPATDDAHTRVSGFCGRRYPNTVCRHGAPSYWLGSAHMVCTFVCRLILKFHLHEPGSRVGEGERMRTPDTGYGDYIYICRVEYIGILSAYTEVNMWYIRSNIIHSFNVLPEQRVGLCFLSITIASTNRMTRHVPRPHSVVHDISHGVSARTSMRDGFCLFSEYTSML